MLDTAGKISERIIYQRIDAIVDALLADIQNGFRKGRSMLNGINLLVNIAINANRGSRWKGGRNKYFLVVALDIKWNLEEKNVPICLRRIVASYLTDRVVKYDTMMAQRSTMLKRGASQGSVLGQLLWNIIYDSIFGSNDWCRLNFKQKVDHVCPKAPAVCANPAWLMPNIGSPKRSRRVLISVVTYGISNWADTLEK